MQFNNTILFLAFEGQIHFEFKQAGDNYKLR